MSFYTDAALITPDGADWVTASLLVWEIGREGSGLKITVPEGFKTDLASIPFWARFALNPADGRYAKAAILHDYLLSIGWDRVSAASQFHQALIADGAGAFSAGVMGLAVLIGKGPVQT